MKKFTDDQIHSLMEQAKAMLEGIGEGQSVRDIMARHYADSLDDKTLDQGLIMADAMLEAVKDFDTDYHKAVEDMDGFIRRFQEEAEDLCRALQLLAAAGRSPECCRSGSV